MLCLQSVQFALTQRGQNSLLDLFSYLGHAVQCAPNKALVNFSHLLTAIASYYLSNNKN